MTATNARISLDADTDLVVMTSAAKMPNSCCGRYCRVALVQVAKGTTSKQIRDTKTATVLCTREKCHDGGERSASARAIRELTERAVRMSHDRMERGIGGVAEAYMPEAVSL